MQQTAGELLEWLRSNAFTTNGNFNNWATKRIFWDNRGGGDLFDHLVAAEPRDYSITEKVWNLFHARSDCRTCGRPTQFVNYKSGYRQYCSTKCVTSNQQRNQKISIATISNTERQDKAKTTCLERYGVTSKLQLQDQQNLMKAAKLAKHGSHQLIYDKQIEHNLKKYGVVTPLLLNDFQHKMQQAKLAKYGCWFPGYVNVGKSAAELDLIEWLRKYLPDIKKSNSVLPNLLELDGYSADRKFAVEYCGLYWHCELNKKPYYHRYKYQQCMLQGINLITIFEDEWIHRQAQVKQFLLAKLGIFDRRVYARNCQLVQLDVEHYSAIRSFTQDNHIQGSPTSITGGFMLVENNEIIAAVILSHHHRISGETTLSRLAFKSGIQVVGGVSRLLNAVKKFAITNGKQITTWSDNRWTTGDIYEQNGFKLTADLSPDYSYIDSNKSIRLSKQSQQKKLTGCPPNLTEHQWANQRKLYKIHDCGKKRWIFNGTTEI